MGQRYDKTKPLRYRIAGTFGRTSATLMGIHQIMRESGLTQAHVESVQRDVNGEWVKVTGRSSNILDGVTYIKHEGGER